MHSCIYEGRVQHARYGPVAHRFRYPMLAVYLDLDELEGLTARRGLLSTRRWASVSFRRDDHLGGAGAPLDESVRDMVQGATGDRPRGPIGLLTQLRYFGYYFSPLNLYYCFTEDGRRVETVVAEVNNTPWGEQHHYVLWRGNRSGGRDRLHFQHDKAFHVSPFLGMDLRYDWTLSAPGARLRVNLSTLRAGKRTFTAGLTLTRRPLTKRELRRAQVRFPMMTAQIVGAIYYQALRLWLKKCPFYPHPNKSIATPVSATPSER